MRLPRPMRRSHSIVLTSLVDVMFVLLFFFMLAASTVDRRALSIGLPAEGGTDSASMRELRLELASDARWTLDGQPVTASDLDTRLRQASVSRIRVIPATGVKVQVLTDALMIVRAVGLELRLGSGDGA